MKLLHLNWRMITQPSINWKEALLLWWSRLKSFLKEKKSLSKGNSQSPFQQFQILLLHLILFKSLLTFLKPANIKIWLIIWRTKQYKPPLSRTMTFNQTFNLTLNLSRKVKVALLLKKTMTVKATVAANMTWTVSRTLPIPNLPRLKIKFRLTKHHYHFLKRAVP